MGIEHSDDLRADLDLPVGNHAHSVAYNSLGLTPWLRATGVAMYLGWNLAEDQLAHE